MLNQRTFKLSKLAAEDLQQLFFYLRKRYGDSRAEREIRQCLHQLSLLNDEKISGKPVNDIALGYHQLNYLEMSAFYRYSHDSIGVYIVRVFINRNKHHHRARVPRKSFDPELVQRMD